MYKKNQKNCWKTLKSRIKQLVTPFLGRTKKRQGKEEKEGWGVKKQQNENEAIEQLLEKKEAKDKKKEKKKKNKRRRQNRNNRRWRKNDKKNEN